MKFTLPLAILAVAVSVDAAAVDIASPDFEKRYCSAEGQSCDTVKRAADAFSEAIALNNKIPARADSLGRTASIAARQLHELALAIAASHADPTAYFQQLGIPTATTGDSPTEKRDAAPGWCTLFPGQPCWKKRDAAAAVAPSQVKREADPWCTLFPGQPCWKRDAAAKVVPATPDKVKREADPWCTLFPGQPCWKRSTPVEAAVPDKVRREPAPG